MSYIFEIAVWLILFSIFTSNNKIPKIIMSFVGGFFISCQALSLLLTGKFFNYQIYSHANLQSIETYGVKFYSYMTLFGFCVFLVSAFIFYLSSIIMKNVIVARYKFFLVFILVAVLLLCPNGALSEVYGVYKILSAEEKNFNQALKDIGVSPSEYVPYSKLSAKKGKNIVVISVESLEQGFLGAAFENLTPNLNRLREDWTFYGQMPLGPGGEWTAGALYNLLVGAPAFFQGQGNDFFQNTTNAKLIGLGHVLEKAGYVSRYLVGNADFAGMSDLLEVYKIKVVSELNSKRRYPRVRHGLHDYDLFYEAKLQIDELSNSTGAPFALFLSTANTHFPNGYFDERMLRYVSGRENQLEFAVASIDYLINDFVKYLESNDLLDNTAIFILPDHLLMGGGDEVHEKLNKAERQLFLLTNSRENNPNKKTSDKIYQIQLPRIIIEGAGIDTNAKFLSDYIAGDPIEFVKKNIAEITAINTASITREDYKDGFKIYVNDGELFIDCQSGHQKTSVTAVPNGVYDFTFNKDMVLVSAKQINYLQDLGVNDYDKRFGYLHLFAFMNDGNLNKVYFGDKRTNGFYRKGSELEITVRDVLNVTEANNRYLLMMKDNNERANSYRKDVDRFIAHAGGKIGEFSYTDCLEALDLSFEKGFRFFELDIIKTSDNVYVAAHDWKHWAKITQYEGGLPPTRDVFMQQKIHGKYTPLDIDSINHWFKEHPDAILVTDKVNDPVGFASKFIDSQRLMMELFSWDSVEKGLDAKIKSVMPTGDLLFQFRGDIVRFLEDNGIKDVAVSRRFADTQQVKILKSIADSGVNIYAFHVNFDKGKDEKYVACNERNFFYGMYADDWDFDYDIDCTRY